MIRIRSTAVLWVGCLAVSQAVGQQLAVPADSYGVPVAAPYRATTAEPVYVEPCEVDPWMNPPGHDAIVLDGVGWPGQAGAYPPPSPAAQDLGNLIPPGSRPGFFQKLNFGAMWMPRFESDGLGMTQANANIVTALPFPGRHQPLTITPEYTVRFLDGPDFVDVPSRLHDLELKFNHIRRVSDRWIFNGAVTLGSYADDQSFDADHAFRVSGRAIGIYEASANSKWLAGIAYLNRAGFSVVPVVGWLYWTEDLKIDAVLPQPKIAWRTWSGGAPGYDERWFYLGGDFGGGIWSVERADGSTDELSYTDYRMLFGTERIHIGALSRRWEIGYVFGRELEYESVGSDMEIDDTLFVRAAFTY